MKNNLGLKSRYAHICERYLQMFCDNYGFQYKKDSWVGGFVGTIANVCDFYFDFHNVIKYSVDNNLSDKDELLEWWQYCYCMAEFDLIAPTFQSWHLGCPRISREKIVELWALKQTLDDVVNELK